MTDHIPAPSFPANLDEYAPWVAQYGLHYPYGQCQCGCGQAAPISDETCTEFGWAPGHPKRFIQCHHHKARQIRPLEDRFWEHVERKTIGECWIWTGRTSKGYGVLSQRGRNIRMHRFSYELHNGPIPAGMAVCHQCDNPLCVNPAHLWLGTIQQNNGDRISKGRTTGGSMLGQDHPQAKLTDTQVATIRKRIADGVSLTAIGKEFGVSRTSVANIKRHSTWSHTS